jgi:hypothetical protein
MNPLPDSHLSFLDKSHKTEWPEPMPGGHYEGFATPLRSPNGRFLPQFPRQPLALVDHRQK